jgi:hypothetical protein
MGYSFAMKAATLLGMIAACAMVFNVWWRDGAWVQMCFVGAGAMLSGSACTLAVLKWQQWRLHVLSWVNVS